MSQLIGFHFEGQYCMAEIKNSKIKHVWCDGVELNITDDIKSAVSSELQKQNEGGLLL